MIKKYGIEATIAYYIEKRKYVEVERLLESVWEINDQLFTEKAINLWALMKYRDGNFKAAKNLFQKSYALNNNSYAEKWLKTMDNEEEQYAIYYSALEYCAEKEYSKAISELKKISMNKAFESSGKRLLMLLYLKSMRFDKAFLLILKDRN